MKKPVTDLSENELHSLLKLARWPNGFECPRCSKVKAERRTLKSGIPLGRDRKKAGQSNPLPTNLKEWIMDNGRVVCPECGLQTSLTSGTWLDGTRLSLTTIRDAALCFLGATEGMSAKELGAKMAVYQPTARKLIGKFHKVMGIALEEGLCGTVQLDKGVLVLAPAKRKSKPHVPVIIAVEKRTGSSGRIGLKMSKYWSESIGCGLAAWMIRKDATIETYHPYFSEYMKEHGYQFRKLSATWKTTNAPLSPQCAAIFDHVTKIVNIAYRRAIKKDNLQGYLDEISFRWNHRDDVERAAIKLMARLLQPPRIFVNPFFFGFKGSSDDALP